jgi:hypothetical protein
MVILAMLVIVCLVSSCCADSSVRSEEQSKASREHGSSHASEDANEDSRLEKAFRSLLDLVVADAASAGFDRVIARTFPVREPELSAFLFVATVSTTSFTLELVPRSSGAAALVELGRRMGLSAMRKYFDKTSTARRQIVAAVLNEEYFDSQTATDDCLWLAERCSTDPDPVVKLIGYSILRVAKGLPVDLDQSLGAIAPVP